MSRRYIKENPAEDGAGAGDAGDDDLNRIAQIPEEVFTLGKPGNNLRIQHLAGKGIDNLDLFDAILVIQIDGIQADAMRLPVGKAQIDGFTVRGGHVGGHALAGIATLCRALGSEVELSRITGVPPVTLPVAKLGKELD